MIRPSLKTVMMLGVCLAPLTALAQDGGFDLGEAPATSTAAPEPVYLNEITLGLRLQGQDSAKFGRYNGYPNGILSPFFSGSFKGGDAWDSGETFFYSLVIDNFTYNSRSALPNSTATLKFGHQGSWEARAFFDNISYTQSLNFNSPNDRSGALVLGAPGGVSLTGISLSNPPNASDISIAAAAAKVVTQHVVDLQRRSGGFSFTDELAGAWTITVAYTHEHKEGTKENSLLQSSSTGTNSNAGNIIYFPELVDYDTDRFSTVLAYTTPELQGQLSYVMSSFTNDHLSTVLIDPYNTNNIISVPKSATYALPPTSLAQQIKGQLGYNFSDSTRLNATFAYGLQLQNAAFPAQSTNPSVTPPTGSGTTFDGRVQTLFGNITLTSRPITDLDLKLAYTIDDRDNQSPRRTFNALLNDRSTFFAITTNAPYSFQYQKGVVEAGYSVLPETRVVAGYSYQQKSRTYSAVDRNDESTFYARLNTMLADDISAAVSVNNSVRASTTYDGNAPWLALGTSEANSIDNNGLKHYHEAPRTRTEAQGDVSWMPLDGLSVSVASHYYRDHYSQSLYGITEDKGLNVTPDIGYAPSNDLSGHLFYTYEEVYYHMNDVVTPGGGGSPFYWTLGTPNIVHTIGFDGDWQASEKLKLSTTYTYQRGVTGFNEIGMPSGSLGSSPWNFNVVPLPSNRTVVNSLSLQAQYQWDSTTSIVLGYQYEQLDSLDYVNDQTATSPFYANAILGADGSPNYEVSIGTIAYRVKF